MAGPIKVPVVSQQALGGQVYHLVLAAPEVAAAAVPGQFLHLRVAEGHDPLLRRPLSICEADREEGTVALLYQVRGRGTAWLAGRRAGERLDVLGPLGRGFPAPPRDGPCFLVGGGLGVAPLLFLATALHRGGIPVVFLAGAESAAGLYRLSTLTARGIAPAVATVDGSAGYRGPVTELLARYLRPRAAAALYACGPREMLREVARLGARAGTPTFVSLEEVMACGTGLCRGCAVPVRGGRTRYERVCAEGPVFPAERVAWDAL